MKRTPLAITIGLLCCHNAMANAETTDQQTYFMQEMVVSATRTEQDIRDVSASVVAVSAADVEKAQAQNLKQVFADEPGVSLSTDGRFGLAGVNIRGRDSNYVKTMVDGIELPSSYAPDWSEGKKYNNGIELDTLATLEVNKGPASSLYGSDALGGALILRTKNPADLLGDGDGSAFNVHSGYASADDSYKVTAEAANRSGDLETLLIYTHRNGHAEQTHSNDNSIGPDRGKADPSDYHSNNYLAKAYYQLDDQNRIGITGEYFSRGLERQLLSEEGSKTRLSNENYLYYYNVSSISNDRRYRASLEHQWLGGCCAFDELQWSVALLDSQSQQDKYDDRYLNDDFDYQRRRHYFMDDRSWQADLLLFKGLEFNHGYHEISYGANWVHNDFKVTEITYNLTENTNVENTTRMPDATSTKWGVFVQDQMFLADEKLVVTAGLRYDGYKATPDNSKHNKDKEEDEQYKRYYGMRTNAFTGRLGAVYHWNHAFSTYAQISQGFKAPTLQDLYYGYSTGAVIVANPDLKPEESLSYEVGLRFNSASTKLSLAGYYNDYKNFFEMTKIDAPDLGTNVYTTLNIDSSEIYGIEFKTDWDLAQLMSMPAGFSAGFNVAWAKGRDKDTGNAINSVAPLSSNLKFGYDAPSGVYGSQLSLKAVAAKSGSDWAPTSSTQLDAPGYATLDLTAYYQPLDQLTVRAGVFNLTDKKYWDYMRLSGLTNTQGLERRTETGRNIGVDVSYRF
ncbi:MAG: TonB-dependent hemoglobin/transferrin/lactoferrin family receptor [Ferrimonas sp.]